MVVAVSGSCKDRLTEVQASRLLIDATDTVALQSRLRSYLVAETGFFVSVPAGPGVTVISERG
jgi:hypothetical protein